MDGAPGNKVWHWPAEGGTRLDGAAQPRTVLEPTGFLSCWALVAPAGLASVFLFPVGFMGWDDLSYLEASERWLDEGPHAGADHWANRLPYVLAISAARRMINAPETALLALHSILFCIVVLTAWALGRIAFRSDPGGAKTALFSLLMALATPMLFQIPTTYYPEAMEIALAGLCVLLVLSRDHGGVTAARLLLAGVLGGLAVMVRQTAIALPLGLGLLLLTEPGCPLRDRIQTVAWLAAGVILVQVAEVGFYVLLTGDPLYRFHVDAQHVQIPSAHLVGGVHRSSDGVLFNWGIAAKWQINSVLHVHWTLTPLIQLLTSPGLLLLPWLALAGGWRAWRAGAAGRRFVLLAGLVLLLQYLINTFIFVIAPNTRYFGVALLLLCPLAGYALASMPSWFAGGLMALLLLAVQPAVILLRPSQVKIVPAMERLVALAPAGQVVHLPPFASRMAALRLRADPALAARVNTDLVPLGGLAIGGRFGWPEPEGETRCVDLSATDWERLATVSPPNPVWDAVQTFGLERLLSRLGPVYQHRDWETLHLLRRTC